ncbi:hypothetical protein BdWA1_003141 [Babesia duncani]|uniref:Uncharacterized protein n=1 Tax=Babesia duncani TaxID=323732 RepID=A0AAD9PIS2_9APIC|nr:hypothetical protein BdWA1_003141 [Babesia duncani]
MDESDFDKSQSTDSSNRTVSHFVEKEQMERLVTLHRYYLNKGALKPHFTEHVVDALKQLAEILLWSDVNGAESIFE